MAHQNIFFQTAQQKIPGHVFEKYEFCDETRRYCRKLSNRSQLWFWLFCHLDQVKSLREGVTRLSSVGNRLYHVGIRDPIKLSTLSEANSKRNPELFKNLFFDLLSRSQKKFKRKFSVPIALLDSTAITSREPKMKWAKYNKQCYGVKVHVKLDMANDVPLDVTITNGNVSDLKVARDMDYEPGSILVVDRAYSDTLWWRKLNENGVKFITRLKRGYDFNVIEDRYIDRSAEENILSDKVIQLMGNKSSQYGDRLRLVTAFDPIEGRTFDFITNYFDVPASMIANLYRQRWRIELFFKWIKQRLKIKKLLALSHNGILTQIWTAMIAYLILWQLYHEQGHREKMTLLEYSRQFAMRLFLPIQPREKKKKPPDLQLTLNWEVRTEH